MKNLFMKRVAVCLSLAIISGCSLGNSATQKLTINTTEPDSEIWVNGQMRGKSPLTVDVDRNKNVSIMARKDGFETGNRSLGTHLSEEGKMDIVGTILIGLPVIGLLSPGAWSIDETEIVIPMLPGKKL